MLVSESNLFANENIGGIPDYNTNIMDYRNGGICNLEEFIFRMNIFCTDNPKNNLFEDFDFIKHNVAISGSIMAACLQKNHPLMNIFWKYQSKFVDYFDEYYSEADIDVMFIAKDIPTFTKNVRIFYDQVCVNMIKINSQYNNTKLELHKLGYLFVTYKFIQENISQDKIKIRWIKKNINTDEVLELFKPFYDKLKYFIL